MRLKCRLMSIEEQQDKRVHLTALEHNPTLDALRNSAIGGPPGCISEDCEGAGGGRRGGQGLGGRS